jgi:hypothetical protein
MLTLITIAVTVLIAFGMFVWLQGLEERPHSAIGNKAPIERGGLHDAAAGKSRDHIADPA